MQNLEFKRTAKKLAQAFNSGKVINPISTKFTKNSKIANAFRVECESLIKSPVIGFKAGGTGIAMLKKLGEKEPFYASIFKKNLLKSGGSVKINKYTLGIELEVFFQIKKSLFKSKAKVTEINASLTDWIAISLVSLIKNNESKIKKTIILASLKLGNLFAIFKTISTI